MFVVMPYFVLLEAMMSHFINGGTFLIFGAHVSQFHFLPLSRQGWAWAMWATLMLNRMMPWPSCIISLCSAMCHMDLIDVTLSRMTPVNQSHFP